MERSERPRANLDRLAAFVAGLRVLPFDSAAAAAYGRLRHRLESAGTPLGPNDLLIAAHALSLGAVLVTDDVAEFGRVRGLRVENWRRP